MVMKNVVNSTTSKSINQAKADEFILKKNILSTFA
uniref:Uncharacterized protein n=1 Tax=Vitis vinifera TaxID=29760 RepID=F6I4R8_VITVI